MTTKLQKTIAILLTCGAFTGNAAVVMLDHFDYVAGNLSQANTGSLWSRTGTGDSIQIVDGNLTYPGLEASSGRMVQWGGDGRISRTDFTGITSGSVYASFIYRMDTLAPLTTTGGPVAGLLNTANTANPNARLYARRDALNSSTFNFGILERGSAVNWSSTQYNPGESYFVVFNLDMIAGVNNDVANLWINPSADTFGDPSRPAPTISASGGVDAANVSRFRLVQNPTNGSAGLQTIDELRIGTTWADVAVAAVPEPNTIGLVGMIGLVAIVLRRRATR